MPAVQAQKLDAHLDAASKLTGRCANERRVGFEPGIEVRQRHDRAEPERQRRHGLQGTGDDIVVDGEGLGIGYGRQVEVAADHGQVTQTPELDRAAYAYLGRT